MQSTTFQKTFPLNNNTRVAFCVKNLHDTFNNIRLRMLTITICSCCKFGIFFSQFPTALNSLWLLGCRISGHRKLHNQRDNQGSRHYV